MLRKILSATRQILMGCISLPFDFARWFFGQPGMPMPPVAVPYSDEVENQTAELRDRLDAAPVRDPDPAVRTLGGHVHAYAAGDREAFDVSSVPEHVAVALLALDDRQLSALAAAGPVACGRWALGQRSGIVGIPAVKPEGPVSATSTTQDGAQVLTLVPAGEPPCGMPLRLAA